MGRFSSSAGKICIARTYKNAEGRCLLCDVKYIIKRFTMFLGRFSDMSQNEQPSEVQSPIGVASFVCFVSLAFVYLTARPVVSRLQVWWAELLVYAFIPILATFIILYRSCWHREMARVARTPFLIWLSCVIFGGVTIFIGIIIILAFVFFYRFTAFH